MVLPGRLIINKRARLRDSRIERQPPAQLSTETQEQTEGPIQAALNQIDSQASQHHVSVEQAKIILYKETSTDDETALILGELLKVLPAEGQRNLLRDIVGEDNRALTTVASDIKAFLVSQRMSSTSDVVSRSDLVQEKRREGKHLKAQRHPVKIKETQTVRKALQMRAGRQS